MHLSSQGVRGERAKELASRTQLHNLGTSLQKLHNPAIYPSTFYKLGLHNGTRTEFFFCFVFFLKYFLRQPRHQRHQPSEKTLSTQQRTSTRLYCWEQNWGERDGAPHAQRSDILQLQITGGHGIITDPGAQTQWTWTQRASTSCVPPPSYMTSVLQ